MTERCDSERSRARRDWTRRTGAILRWQAVASIVDSYLVARPADFPVVASVRLRQQLPEERTPSLDVVVELARRGDSATLLRLTFRGVLGLCLRQPSWSRFELGVLEIRDVSSDQCEGIRFAVKDPENDALSLSCADIQIEQVANDGSAAGRDV